MVMESNRARQHGRAVWSVVFVVLVLLGGVLFGFRDVLVGRFVMQDAARLSNELNRLLGSTLDPKLKIQVASSETPQALARVVAPGAILVKYSAGCAPCRALVDQYLARASFHEQQPPPLYLISFRADATFPPGIPAGRQLRAAFAREGTWFAGDLTPTAYRTGARGELVEVMVGLESSRLDAWLEPVGPAFEPSAGTADAAE